MKTSNEIDKLVIFSVCVIVLILGSIIPAFAKIVKIRDMKTIEEITYTESIYTETKEIHEETTEQVEEKHYLTCDEEIVVTETEEVIETEEVVEDTTEYIPYIPEVVYLENGLPEDVDIVLREVCIEKNVPYELALGLIFTESRFDPYAISSAGCYGYCQLHPRYFPSNLSPADNIRYGIGWLGDLISEHGSIEVALTVYSAGHDDGTRWYANLVFENAKGFGYTA